MKTITQEKPATGQAKKIKAKRTHNPDRIDPMDSPDMLEKMYVANVSLTEIARYFGYTDIGKIKAARRLLGIRGRPARNNCLTISDFFERKIHERADPAKVAEEDAACRALLAKADRNTYPGRYEKVQCVGRFSKVRWK